MIPLELVKGLRDHLNAELSCYRGLLSIFEQQQQALIANQVAIFSQLTKQTEPNLAEQQRLKKIRERLLLRIAEIMEKKNGSPTITQIIAVTNEPLQGELKARQLLIRDALERIRTVQERNQALLRQGLGLMRDLVSALTGENEPQSYDRRGLGGAQRSNGRIVNLAG